MSIRINRERIASVIQAFGQKREDATYTGPRSVSDRDVQVTLPLNAQLLAQEQVISDRKFSSSGGSSTLQVEVGGTVPPGLPNPFPGQFVRLLTVSATLAAEYASTVSPFRVQFYVRTFDPAGGNVELVEANKRWEGNVGETMNFAGESIGLFGALLNPGFGHDIRLNALDEVTGGVIAFPAGLYRKISYTAVVTNQPFVPVR